MGLIPTGNLVELLHWCYKGKSTLGCSKNTGLFKELWVVKKHWVGQRTLGCQKTLGWSKHTGLVKEYWVVKKHWVVQRAGGCSKNMCGQRTLGSTHTGVVKEH